MRCIHRRPRLTGYGKDMRIRIYVAVHPTIVGSGLPGVLFAVVDAVRTTQGSLRLTFFSEVDRESPSPEVEV